MLDLFCGLGNFTLPLARTVGEVVGVEGDIGLVERARRMHGVMVWGMLNFLLLI